MRHRMICKYDFDDPADVDDWTTLTELMRRDGHRHPPASYLRLERSFVEVAERFYLRYQDRGLHWRYCYVCGEAAQLDAASPWLEGLTQPLAESLAQVGSPLHTLSDAARRGLFQLAVRGEIGFAIQSRDPEPVVLSTMDEGFYWFVSLPDEDNPAALLDGAKLFIYDSIDIFDPA